MPLYTTSYETPLTRLPCSSHPQKRVNLKATSWKPCALFFDSKLESQRLAFEKVIENMAKEISSLRETRSKTSGEKNSSKDFWGYLVAAAGIGLALVFHFIK